MSTNSLIIELLRKLIENLEKGEDYQDLLIGLVPLLGNAKITLDYNNSKKLISTRSNIKKIIEKDVLKALQTFKKSIKTDSSVYNEITLLITAHNRTHQYLTKGLIKYEDALIEFARVDNTLLLLLDNLEEEDLK